MDTGSARTDRRRRDRRKARDSVERPKTCGEVRIRTSVVRHELRSEIGVGIDAANRGGVAPRHVGDDPCDVLLRGLGEIAHVIGSHAERVRIGDGPLKLRRIDAAVDERHHGDQLHRKVAQRRIRQRLGQRLRRRRDAAGIARNLRMQYVLCGTVERLARSHRQLAALRGHGPHRAEDGRRLRAVEVDRGNEAAFVVHDFLKSLVPRKGLEPPRPCGHWYLKPARLPIPPSGRRTAASD